MFKFCVSFVKHYTEKGEIKGDEEKKKEGLFQIHMIIGFGLILCLYLVHPEFQKVLL